MIPCPKCARQNDDEALYCDQCRTAVSTEAHGGVLPDPCPACGGQVKEVPSTAALCGDCGIFLGEAGQAEGSDAAAPNAPSQPRPPRPAPAPAAPAGPVETAPCPVCGDVNAVDAGECVGCGLFFTKSRTPRPCPKCEAESVEDVCGCGAVLSLRKLAGFVDGKVRVVCQVCKQLFTIDRTECSDCGGETRPAEALKAYASTHPL